MYLRRIKNRYYWYETRYNPARNRAEPKYLGVATEEEVQNYRKQSKEKLAYFAGLIDGEGWIGIWKGKPTFKSPYYSIEISVANTYKPILDELKAFFGCGAVKPPYKKGRTWTWSTTSNKAKEVLENLLPYLKIKKEQAKLAIELQIKRKTPYNFKESITPEELEWRENIYQKCRELNRKITKYQYIRPAMLSKRGRKPTLCKCGCGQVVKSPERGSRYVRGHHTKT